MKLNSLDLNLLVALDALITESSVARAGVRLGRSQPAASHALRHLRDLFDDPLLVRVGHQMQLTPKAESLREPLRNLLGDVELLLSASNFDPATSSRVFRLMTPDLVTSILVPPLVECVMREAPGVVLDVVGWRGPETLTSDFAQMMDIIISWTGDAFPGFHRQRLYLDRDALAFRAGHPQTAALSTREGFLAAKHISVVGSGEAKDPIDEWLATNDMKRSIAVVVPNYLQALQVAASSNLVAFVPVRMIMALGAGMGLETCSPPVDPGADQQYLFYPARAVRDPGSLWLRQLIKSVCLTMPAID